MEGTTDTKQRIADVDRETVELDSKLQTLRDVITDAKKQVEGHKARRTELEDTRESLQHELCTIAPHYRPPADGTDRTGTLPDEMLVLVLRYVDSKTVMLAVPAVCQRWKALCRTQIAVELDFTWALGREEFYNSWKWKDERDCCRLTDADLAAMAGRFSCVASVRLQAARKLTPAGAATIATPSLKALTVKIDDQDFGPQFNIDSFVAVFDVKSCPGLEAIDLSDCYQLTDTGLEKIAGGETPHPRLRSLGLVGCDKLTDAGLSLVLASCPRLQPDSIFSLKKGDAFVSLLSLLSLQSPLHSKTLDLSGCKQVTDIGLDAVADGCPDLQHLDLSRCTRVTDLGLERLSAGNHELRSLNLSRCTQITDAGLELLAVGCPQLQRLVLGNCTQVSEAGLIKLAEGCAQLRDLALRGCGQITDAELEVIGSFCRNLEHLDLTSCSQVSDVGLEKIGSGCSKLRSLTLDQSMRITDAGLQLIREGCPRLTHPLGTDKAEKSALFGTQRQGNLLPPHF